MAHCVLHSSFKLEQVGAQTETELKEKKLRVEDALNATKVCLLAVKLSLIIGCSISVLSNENFKYGYNAATGKYEDLMAAGIIDPTKVRMLPSLQVVELNLPLWTKQVVRCCLEHAASVAKTFLTSDVVVVDIKEPEPVTAGNPMDNSGIFITK
ncbi:hypothetical protein B296_00013949 [Ensete ventricosum]|uniref:Uncharacterized protein n=1 Tax=Ensete ventricosum TaxID=4639 RepID=A0A427ADG7_ENSVE|nr:hypothetical protein B296_00013949 [Ensete ventricosum]